MKATITLVFIFGFLSAIAQPQQNVDYFKFNGKRVALRDSADYTRVVSMPDSGSLLYKVTEYYANGKLKRIAESTTVDPIKPEGTSISYYQNGKRQLVNKYVDGMLRDEQYLYYPNGKLNEVRNYPAASDEAKSVFFDRAYTIVEQNDSTGKSMVANGNGHYQIMEYGFMTNKLTPIQAEGDVKHGLKDGIWKSTVGKDSIGLVETYEKGILITGIATFANGDTSHYNTPEKLPEFKGGIDAFYKFIGKNLRYPAEDVRLRTQGRVNLIFVVESDGSITHVKQVGHSPSPSLSNEAVRVVSQSPKWIPAIQFGRFVRVQYTVPIVFSLGGYR